MLSVTFIIPGKPFGKQRPRFSRRSGRAYTPAKTIEHEAAIAAAAKEHFPEPLDGPIKLVVAAVFEPPKSWSKAKKAEHLGRSHMQAPDADNIIKAVADGLNGIAYRDDSQVAAMEVVKVWGPSARTVITVRTLSE